MTEARFSRIAIIGLGLIGASLALAIRRAGLADTIIGSDADASVVERARKLGLVDEAGTEAGAAVAGADLVILCAPVGAFAAIGAQIAPHLGPGAIVTTVSLSIRDTHHLGWVPLATCLAVTASSGPGIALKGEFLGLANAIELPLVVINVQRCGPSTGMPTRTQQADLMACAYASHGDTRHVLLFPANPEECFYLAVQAFDLAERLQTPVIMLTDLDIGMNDWMCRDLNWNDDYRPDRGKVLSEEELEQAENFYRYLDRDGDGIASRSLPGVHPKGAFFTRGSGHNKYGAYTEDSDDYLEVVDRLRRKWETAKGYVPEPEIQYADTRRIAIISIGSCDDAVQEARDQLSSQGVATNYLRVLAFPFNQQIQDFLDKHERIYVVEQNRDAQLRSLLLLETEVEQDKLVPVLHYNGLPLNAGAVVAAINEDLARGQAA